MSDWILLRDVRGPVYRVKTVDGKIFDGRWSGKVFEILGGKAILVTDTNEAPTDPKEGVAYQVDHLLDVASVQWVKALKMSKKYGDVRVTGPDLLKDAR